MQKEESKKESAKLLCCPFCGGKAEIHSDFSYFVSDFWIVCKRCGCKQESSISKESVIEAWNTRKPMEAVVAELEASAEGAKDSKDLSKWSAYKQAISIVRGKE